MASPRACTAHTPSSERTSSGIGCPELGGAKALEGTDLSLARLTSANLSGANLEEANLKGANLGDANFDKARYHRNTVRPDHFDPAASGAVLTE